MYNAHIYRDPVSGAEEIQTCAEHSRNTAERTREILAPRNLPSAGYLAGLLHDCGKFTDEFNEYLRKAVHGEPVRKGSVIHTFAGVGCLLNAFHSKNAPLVRGDLAAEALSVAIASHHGLIDLWDERRQSGFLHRLTAQPEYDARALRAFYKECAAESEIRTLYAKAQEEIDRFFQQSVMQCAGSAAEGRFALGLMVRLMTSAVVDADRTDTARFMHAMPAERNEPAPWDECVRQVDAYTAGFPCLSPVQRARRAFSDECAAAAENDRGLYRLDLPTGGGKTLASLRFAVRHARKHGMRRIFYVAPLLSIIEQNADAIRSALSDAAPVLEHHSNVLRDGMSEEEAARTELLVETWDAPVIVTTLVQLLETLFGGGMSSVRRFHALCDSVIILDEVQSLPRRLLSMFNCAVNFLTVCCGTTVVLCSATQPAFERAVHRMRPCRRLIGEDVFRRYAPLFRRTEIFDAGTMGMEDVAEKAAELLEESDSLLIVCNTKKEAVQAYCELEMLPEIRRFHLSAGMCPAHRRDRLTELTRALERHEKLACVSTQVIEAGIDISFASVIRFCAGLDNVVQTAGRCNRHGEFAALRPVSIYRLRGERLGPLREIAEAQDALNALLEEYRICPERYDSDLASDAAVCDYYEFLYRAMPIGAQDAPAHGHTLFALLSENRQFMPDGAQPYLLNQAFRTAGEWFEAFDYAGGSVLAPYREGRELIEQMQSERARYDARYARELLRRSKQYAVSVPTQTLERMYAKGMIFPILDGGVYALNDGFYDDEIGIKEGDDSCSTLIL